MPDPDFSGLACSFLFLFPHTLLCHHQASQNGATGVELDLEFTADGVPVLMHDETVDRTTNGSGPLSKLRFSEVNKLDAAAKHRLRYKSTTRMAVKLKKKCKSVKREKNET